MNKLYVKATHSLDPERSLQQIQRTTHLAHDSIIIARTCTSSHFVELYSKAPFSKRLLNIESSNHETCLLHLLSSEKLIAT
jgi:hypothetical protein